MPAGGGPAGLSTAILLAQLGWRNIRVLDRLARPQRSDDGLWGNSDRSYLLGVSESGQRVLDDLGVMPRVHACSTPLLYRAQWTPQKPDGEGMDRRQEPDRTRPATQVRRAAVPAALDHQTLHDSTTLPALLGTGSDGRPEGMVIELGGCVRRQ